MFLSDFEGREARCLTWCTAVLQQQRLTQLQMEQHQRYITSLLAEQQDLQDHDQGQGQGLQQTGHGTMPALLPMLLPDPGMQLPLPTPPAELKVYTHEVAMPQGFAQSPAALWQTQNCNTLEEPWYDPNPDMGAYLPHPSIGVMNTIGWAPLNSPGSFDPVGTMPSPSYSFGPGQDPVQLTGGLQESHQATDTQLGLSDVIPTSSVMSGDGSGGISFALGGGLRGAPIESPLGRPAGLEAYQREILSDAFIMPDEALTDLESDAVFQDIFGVEPGYTDHPGYADTLTPKPLESFGECAPSVYEAVALNPQGLSHSEVFPLSFNGAPQGWGQNPGHVLAPNSTWQSQVNGGHALGLRAHSLALPSIFDEDSQKWWD